MAPIIAVHHLSFTVTDLARSVDWYRRVLELVVDAEVKADTFLRTRLRHPESAIVLTLTQHDRGSGDAFDETRTGLDHVAFRVPSVADVESFQAHLAEQGVDHSPVKRSDFLASVTLRDPDNIQLEVMALV